MEAASAAWRKDVISQHEEQAENVSPTEAAGAAMSQVARN
jgi:hypothetical protein